MNVKLTLDQRRAAHAARRIGAGDAASKSKIADGLPGLLLSNGLAMTVAYLREKKHDQVLGDLQDWLLKEGPRREMGLAEGADLLGTLLQSDSRATRAASSEALAYLAWYKRLAKALAKR
jgi:CRISPR type III-B/RAMP module-associated protein Cmr5